MKELLLIPAALSVVVAWGCGGSRSANFGDRGGSQQDAAPPADAGPSDDATVLPTGDGGALVLGPARDAGASTVSVCAAGHYQGSFMTYVGAGGDGGSPGLFSMMWNGQLTVDLQAKKIIIASSSGNGESFTTDKSRLEIAEGGALEGGDTMGGTFFANLDGELNCDPDAGPPYQLNATLSNGTYKQALFSLAIGGRLSAEYQASNPAMLTNSQILVYGILMDGGAPFASASGTWSATWVSP